MSIVIQNMGPVGEADKDGLHYYELRINKDVIATFVHRRSDGLALCLLEAAVAAARESNMSKSMVKRIAAQKGL